MARKFAFNSLAGAKRTSTAIVEALTAGRFDPAYVASSIALVDNSAFFEPMTPFLDGTSVLDGTLYFRFDGYGVSGAATTGSALWQLNNGAVGAYRLFPTVTNQLQMQYWNTVGAGWANWGGTFGWAGGVLETLVIKLAFNNSYEIYKAGTLVASSAVVPTNGQAQATRCIFNNCHPSQTTNLSQIMCADYDLRDSHLMLLPLNGNSAVNTAGTGAYTDINEAQLDDSTAIVLAAAGKKGQTHSAITVPGGLGISAVVLNARGRVSGGVVTDGKLGVRSGGANYSSPGLAFNGGYEPRATSWDGDPATASAWTQTSLNNAEFYVEAA